VFYRPVCQNAFIIFTVHTLKHEKVVRFAGNFAKFQVRHDITGRYVPIYIQQDAALHSLFISGNCSTCFGWYHNPSSGAQTTVSTASRICHTVTAICRYRERVGTGLSVLCHLLVLLGDLTFMGPCIVSIFQYTRISNKMQRYTVYLHLETALHVSGGNTTHHQERIQLYLQHLVFVTPLLLSAAIVEELEPV
jgi:hypothetical protein